MYYIGSRVGNKLPPDKDQYYSSSKIVSNLVKNNPQDWKKEILETGTREEILLLEKQILATLEVEKYFLIYTLNQTRHNFYSEDDQNQYVELGQLSTNNLSLQSIYDMIERNTIQENNYYCDLLINNRINNQERYIREIVKQLSSLFHIDDCKVIIKYIIDNDITQKRLYQIKLTKIILEIYYDQDNCYYDQLMYLLQFFRFEKNYTRKEIERIYIPWFKQFIVDFHYDQDTSVSIDDFNIVFDIEKHGKNQYYIKKLQTIPTMC